MKKIKIYLFLSLLFILIFNINNISYALTSNEVEEFTQEMLDWQIRFNERPQGNGYAQNIFFNSNYWVSEKNNVNFEDYDSVLIRSFVNNNYRTVITLTFFNYNQWSQNFTCVGKISIDSAINGDSTKIIPITDITNCYHIEYVCTTQGLSQTSNFTKTIYTNATIYSPNSNGGGNFTNANTLYMIKNNIANRTNYKILGYNIYNQIKASDSVVYGITKMADLYIGEYYATGSISYRLYYTRLGDRVYLDWNYNVVYENELQYNRAIGELYALNILDEIETSTAYIEAVYNDDYVIATSNIFNLQVILPIEPTGESISTQYNNSGEPIGYIDFGNITSVIQSGDNKIIEQLKQNESGDKQRFDYWVGFFNPSGDNISNNIINSSGDIFGINYENIDDYGILNFVLNLFNSLYELLFNNTSNVSLDMGMFGSLNSAVFVISNSAVNRFLSKILNPTVILITIFFYYRFIKNIVTLDLSVLDKYDIDNNIKLF